MKKIRIVLADDHKVFVEAMQGMFAQHPEIEVVGIASESHLILPRIMGSQPDVIVLDISLQADKDGIDIAREIQQLHPSVGILILSMHAEYTFVRKLRDMRVGGYLLKEEGRDELELAIKAIAAGGEYFSKKIIAIEKERKSSPRVTQAAKFTTREKEVLRGLALGLDNPDIADMMGVKQTTVETHIKGIREKTGISGARGLVKYAIDHGYGDADSLPLK